MRNICFIANYYKTDVFVKIAEQLQKQEITSYWIVPNAKQYSLLCELFPKEQVLYIGKKEVLSSTKSTISFDLKINELVYGDRVLKQESNSWTYDYLSNLAERYYDFIKLNNISYIFGEVTWAHELIAHRLTLQATELQCQYLNPHTIRIPNGRFSFFTDEIQSKIKEVSIQLDESPKPIELEKPQYLKLNDKLLQKKGTFVNNIKLLRNFIFRTNQDNNDPTLYSKPITQFRIRVKEIFNRIVFKNFITEIPFNAIPKDKKGILFTLHKQPEASIDVIGRYYEDQWELILNIWRIMPKDYILLIKEHSNAIGDRGFSFYKKVKKLPNTYLVHNKIDSHKLLNHVEAVFTVSGTIAYEAALKNKNSFTFAPTFFNKLNNCTQVNWEDFKHKHLHDFSDDQSNGIEINKFSHWLISNSFEGIMSDSFSDSRSIQEDNIKKLSSAFMSVIR